MPYEFQIVRRVEFSETDLAGIMHYSNFFRFMETAEHAFYRSLGFSVVLHGHDPPLGLPRVHASCDFRRPLRFEDEVRVHLLVAEKRSKSLSYRFRFSLAEEGDPNVPPLATGRITIVCVSHAPGQPMKAAPLPAELASEIEVAPAKLLEEAEHHRR